VQLRGLFAAAPEVKSTHSSASPASDVYSLGIAAAEALAGVRFDNDRALREAVRKIKPSGCRPSCSGCWRSTRLGGQPCVRLRRCFDVRGNDDCKN